MSHPDPGYNMRPYNVPVKRYVRTLEVCDDPELLAKYVHYHSRDYIWPEILEGIKAVGILEMDIYMLGTRMVMILEVPADLDFEAAMARLATLPRQQEWEDHVAAMQKSRPGCTSTEKWRPMERIFHLYED